MTTAQLAEIESNLERVRPHVEAARRDATARGHAMPDNARGIPTLSAEASNRPARIALAVKSFSAPAALADEIAARGLTLQQAHDLLTKAAGRERTISAAGVQQVRLALTALDVAARNIAAKADSDRTQAVADLLHRYGLAGTHAGAQVASSKHHVDTLRALLHSRANVFGRVTPGSQLALMRDLMLTPLKETQ